MAPLLGTLKLMLIKALATGNSLHKAPFWGTWGGGLSFLRAFERREKFLLSAELL